mgnify:CR=1 FL=1
MVLLDGSNIDFYFLKCTDKQATALLCVIFSNIVPVVEKKLTYSYRPPAKEKSNESFTVEEILDPS